MHQIKLFSGPEDQRSAIEADVNLWLRQSNARVLHVTGSMSPQSMLAPPDAARRVSTESGSRRFAPSDIFLCILYEAP